jgi:hypothetical protein
VDGRSALGPRKAVCGRPICRFGEFDSDHQAMCGHLRFGGDATGNAVADIPICEGNGGESEKSVEKLSDVGCSNESIDIAIDNFGAKSDCRACRGGGEPEGTLTHKRKRRSPVRPGKRLSHIREPRRCPRPAAKECQMSDRVD